MNIRPLHDLVLCRASKLPTETKGGLIIPLSVKGRQDRAEVIEVGPGRVYGKRFVEPRTKTAYDNVDVDYVMVINDGAHGYTLNGKSFPATEPVVAKRGQRVRIRFMNEGMMIHPMHLHGMHMTVIAKDGWPLPPAGVFKCDTLNIAPGERWDVLVDCDEPENAVVLAATEILRAYEEAGGLPSPDVGAQQCYADAPEALRRELFEVAGTAWSLPDAELCAQWTLPLGKGERAGEELPRRPRRRIRAALEAVREDELRALSAATWRS